MGLRLAELLSSAIDEHTTDDKDRPAVLLEAATAATVDTPTVEGLLDQSLTTLPPEDTVRRIVEAVGADADALVTAARGDGDVFEGDEIDHAGDVIRSDGAKLVEAVGPGEEEGTTRYKVVVIRPGQAAGHGSRYYAPKMLEANAGNFGGQPIFFNHEDLPTILKRGHGSRDPRDLAGWLQESTSWDPSYKEADDKKNGRETGAVIGFADFLEPAAELVGKLPKAVALSVCMDPTKIKVGRTPSGKIAPLVEGVVKGSGSLDLITGKAGAGGKVLERLRESAMSRYAAAHADLASVTDERLVEAARSRPDVLAALRDDPQPEGDPVKDEDVKKLVESALAEEGTTTVLVEAVAQSPAFGRVVEAAVAAERDSIRDEATAESNRLLDLRDMRDEAHRLIEAAGRERGGILSPAFTEDLKSRYTLRDGRWPTPALDVHPELNDADGTVKRSALDVLVEAVTADVEREENKLREAAPARVGRTGAPAPELDEHGAPVEPPKRTDRLAESLGLDADDVHKVREGSR